MGNIGIGGMHSSLAAIPDLPPSMFLPRTKNKEFLLPAASPAGWISERRAADQQSDNGAAHLETAAR